MGLDGRRRRDRRRAATAGHSPASSPRCSASRSCAPGPARSSASSPPGCSSPRRDSSRPHVSGRRAARRPLRRVPASAMSPTSAAASAATPSLGRARPRGHRGRRDEVTAAIAALQPGPVPVSAPSARSRRRGRPRRHRRPRGSIPRAAPPGGTATRLAMPRLHAVARVRLRPRRSHAGRRQARPRLRPRVIPATAEAQWVWVDGEVVERGLARDGRAPGIRRAALVIRGDGRRRAPRRRRQRRRPGRRSATTSTNPTALSSGPA